LRAANQPTIRGVGLDWDGIRYTETTDVSKYIETTDGSKYIEAVQYGSPVNCSKYSKMAGMTVQ
jgi:hypothetical protein